jgi:hypothetical protein
MLNEANVLLAWWTQTLKEVVALSRMPSGRLSCTSRRPPSNIPHRNFQLYLLIFLTVGSRATNYKG